MGVYRPILQLNPELISDQKCRFRHPFSDLEEVTKRNIHVYKDRNYIIITEIRTPTRRHRIRILIIPLSFLSIWTESTNISSHTTVVPSKTTPDSRPKWAKYIPFFRPNRRTNHTVLWGDTYLYGLYKGVLSPRRYLVQATSIGPYKKAVREAHDALYFSSTCVQPQLYEFDFHELARSLASDM